MDKHHETKVINMSKLGKKAYLVKVPKFVSNALMGVGPGREIAKMKIFDDKSKKGTVQFNLGILGEDTPTAYEFIRHDKDGETKAFIMSQVFINPDLYDTSKTMLPGAISIEACVEQKCDIRQSFKADFSNFYGKRFEAETKPLAETKKISKYHQSFKPKSGRIDVRDKKEETKNIRGEKDQVRDQLFALFEKHQYYQIQDLVKITKQPQMFIKEILQEICKYNMQGQHRGLYELKNEYRHYS